MVKAKALVDGVSSISPPTEAPSAREVRAPRKVVTVKFHDGQTGLLDMTVRKSAVWAEVLDSLRQTNQPAYVEIDPKTNVITELLCPLTVRVGEITSIAREGVVEVELIISQARHILRRKNPDFDKLLKTLKSAGKKGSEVLVTETLDDHEIIDVRPLPKPGPRRKK